MMPYYSGYKHVDRGRHMSVARTRRFVMPQVSVEATGKISALLVLHLKGGFNSPIFDTAARLSFEHQSRPTDKSHLSTGAGSSLPEMSF
jgi:hypothetical protein